MKNENKIRKLLGNDYHLSVKSEYTNGKYDITDWRLYRKYKDSKMYFSDNNKPIMTSETHTEEELLKFAKEHHKYNYSIINSNFRVIVAYIIMIIVLINFYFNNNYIKAICLSLDVYIIIECVVNAIVLEHNSKIETKQWKKDMELLLKEIKHNDD